MKGFTMGVLLLIVMMFGLGVQRVAADYTSVSEAYSALSAYTFGDSLGQYSTTTYTSTEVNSYLSQASSSSDDSDSDLLSALNTIDSEKTLNMPEAGTFLRIRSVYVDGYYLSSTTSDTYTEQATVTNDATGAETIFYYDGTSIVSYAKGNYPTASSSTTYYGVNFDTTGSTLTVSFDTIYYNGNNGGTKGTYIGAYSICYGGSYTLSCDNSSYIKGMTSKRVSVGGSWAAFYLEEVTTLPVTLGSTGYATIYSPVALTVPDGVTTHTATIADGNATYSDDLGLTTIPANSGVVLKGTESETISLTTTTTTTDEESEASTASDDDSDEITYMSGQTVTTMASGIEYVLDDGGSWAKANTGDNLAGFTAYAVSTTYDADDLENAWSNLIGDYTVGDDLGEYSATISGSDTYTDYASLLEAVEQLIESTTAESDDYESMISALGSITITFSLNMPTAGMFLRISNTASTPYYLTSGLGTTAKSGVYTVATTTDSEETGTIFYYDGTYLLNFETGYYIAAVTGTGSAFASYDGITTGATITFGATGATSAYYIKFNSRYLYAAENGYTDGGGSYSSGSYYDFYLEEVTELPYTMNTGGYATIYSPVALTVPDGVTVCTVTWNESEASWTETEQSEISILAAETPVLVKGTASTTYSFAISSETGTSISEDNDMGGQVATAYATEKDQYTLEDAESLSFTAVTVGTTELQGFTAYAVGEETEYTYSDVENAWSDETSNYSSCTIGDDLGEYTVTISGIDSYTSYSELKAAIEALIEEGESADADACKTMVSIIDSVTITYTINLPEAGMFLRVQSYGSSYYISSGNGGTISSKNCAAMVTDGTGAGTIFYYDGSGLLNYETGLYLTLSGSSSYMLGYNGIATSGAALTISEANAGYYKILFGGSRSLYGGSTGYTNANSSYSSTNYENWILTEVTELPVELDEAGLAVVSAPVNLAVPDEVTAVYSLAWNNATTVDSTATGATVIPANTAVLIKGEAEATVTLTVSSDDASDISDNELTSTLATITGDDTYYILTYNSYSQFVQATDSVLGFGGYLTSSGGSSVYYFTADYDEATAEPDWDALKAAIDTLSAVGESLGEYSVTGYDVTDVLAVLARAQALYEAQSDGTSAGTVTLYIDSLLTYYDAGLTLNMPEAGMFLRIESVQSSGYYLSSTASESNSSASVYTTDNTGAETIFYYDGSSLLSYGTGNYPVGTSSGMAFETVEADAIAVSFDTIYHNTNGTIEGAYSIHYYNSEASATYVLSISSGVTTGMTNRTAADAYYPAFYLTEVTELPVTMNSSGYKTFYSPVAVEVPSGVKVYGVLLTDGTTEMSSASVSVLAAETPVLLSGTANTTYTFTISDETGTTVGDNGLIGKLAAAYSTGVEYTLSGSDFAVTTSGSDVVDGFSAYLTEEDETTSLTIDDDGYEGFIRIQSVANSTYLASSNYGTVSSASRAAFVSDGTGIETIMYYSSTDNTLISYETGYYLAALSGTYGYYPGWNGVTDPGYVNIVSSSNTTGAYCVLFYKESGRYLYSQSSGYADCGSSDGNTGYRFYIEYVEELPVTLDANGFGTLYTPVALTIPSGVEVYVLTLNDDGSFSQTELLGTVPAGSAVYLSGTANTEYSFTITSSSKSAQTGSLSGQCATQSSVSYAYTLQASDEYSAFEYDDGEIQGFTAYYVGEDESSTYATEDVAAIVALEAVISDYETDAASYTIGSSLGEYSYGDYDSDYVLELLAEAEELLESSDMDTERANEVAGLLETILAETLALNMPEAGSFLRIKSYGRSNYLSSTNSSSQTSRLGFVDSKTDDNEATTILYYTDDGYLIGYGAGYYLSNTSNQAYYAAAGATSGALMQFSAAGSSYVGCYWVQFYGTSSYRYLYAQDGDYSDAGSSTSDNTKYYVFYLETVTELPVTTNEGGGATLYTPVALEIPDGVTAYSITLTSDGDMTKTAIEGDVIPAGTAFYFEGEYSTTYYFTITESSEEAVTSDLAGQEATQSAIDNAYVLSVSNLLNKFVASDDEVQGFTAYLVYEGSSDDDEINFEGVTELDFSSLQSAIAAFDDYPQGDALGEYTYPESLVTLLEEAQELYDLGYNGSTTDSDITSMVNSLTSALTLAYTYLNMPEVNTFFRMRPYRHSTYYVGSTSDSSTGLNLVESCTDDNEAGTIFYYSSDSAMLNYETGIYVDANSSTAYYNGIQSSVGTVFDFSYSGYGADTARTTSAYSVKFTKDGTSLLLGNLASNYYTTAMTWSSSYGNQAYDFYLEEVESLPVTTDSAGYATLYSPVAVEVPTGVSIYTMTYDETSNLLTKRSQSSMTVIPAGTAVMIVGNANKTYDFTLTTASGSAVNGDNDIVGQLATALSTGEEYILQYSADDGTSNFTVTTSESDTIQGFTGYMLLTGESVEISDIMSAITLTTSKSSGETITVLLDYGATVTLSGAVRASDSAEEYTSLGVPVAWTLTDQTVNITSTAEIAMFYAPDGEITSINVASAPYLEKLYLPNNSLTELDVQFETSLEELNVAKNSLTMLTLGKSLTSLAILDCSDNSSLETVDVSSLSGLEELNIANDKSVTSLTLSSEATPTVLIASYSGLTSLPENLNTEAMKVLWFQGCELSSLDLSASSDVRQVYAPAVGLTEISLGKQTGMTDLWIESNELASDTLDLSNVKGLVAVSVSGDGLTDILWNTSNSSTLAYFYASDNGLFFNSIPTVSGLTDYAFANQEDYEIVDAVLADVEFDWTTYLRRNGFGVTYDRTYGVTDENSNTLTKNTDYSYSSYAWTFLTEQDAVVLAVTSAESDSTLCIAAFEVIDPQALIDFEEYVGGYSTEQLVDLKEAYTTYKSDASDDNYAALLEEAQAVLAQDTLKLQEGYYYNIFAVNENSGWYLYNEPTVYSEATDDNEKGISTEASALQILYGDSATSNYFAKLWTIDELSGDGTFKIKNANSALYINGTLSNYDSSTSCFQIAADGDDAGTFSLYDASDIYGRAQWGIQTGSTYLTSGGAEEAYYSSKNSYASILGGSSFGESNSFYIKRVRTVPVTVSTKAEWATLYSPVALRVADTELTAYTGTKVSGSNYVTPNEISDGVIPAETPVLLYAEGGGDYTLYIETSDSLSSPGTLAANSLDNDLEGVTLRDSTMTPKNYYGLSYYSSTGVGFYISGLAVISANKAYLPYESTDTESGYYQFGTPVVEGIEAVAADAADEDEETIYYDLQGRRVVKPKKGDIYVTNKGKKVLYK